MVPKPNIVGIIDFQYAVRKFQLAWNYDLLVILICNTTIFVYVILEFLICGFSEVGSQAEYRRNMTIPVTIYPVSCDIPKFFIGCIVWYRWISDTDDNRFVLILLSQHILIVYSRLAAPHIDTCFNHHRNERLGFPTAMLLKV